MTGRKIASTRCRVRAALSIDFSSQLGGRSPRRVDATQGRSTGSVFCARLFVAGAGEKLPAVQVHLLVLGAAGAAADGHITQVCPHQSGFEIVSGPPAGHPMPNRNVPRCTALETGAPGPATSGSPAPERVPACRRIQWSRHFALAEEASSPYGATDRGRSSCPNQASHGSIRYASATRVRSNAPGRCSNCLKQRPTRLREYPSCYPHATSGHTALQWALTYFRSVYGHSGIRQSPCGGV